MLAGRYSEVDAQAAALAARCNQAPFPQEVEDEAKLVLAACLRATKRARERNPDGDIIYVDIPDNAIRAAVAVKIIEHNIGKPVTRSIVANLTPPGTGAAASTGDDLLQLLLAAPDAAADIVAKLQKAAEKAKKAVPVDVTATPTLPEQSQSSS